MPTIALLPLPLTLCRYTPASDTDPATLKIECQPRTVILKGEPAETAWAWITANTPPALVISS